MMDSFRRMDSEGEFRMHTDAKSQLPPGFTGTTPILINQQSAHSNAMMNPNYVMGSYGHNNLSPMMSPTMSPVNSPSYDSIPESGNPIWQQHHNTAFPQPSRHQNHGDMSMLGDPLYRNSPGHMNFLRSNSVACLPDQIPSMFDSLSLYPGSLSYSKSSEYLPSVGKDDFGSQRRASHSLKPSSFGKRGSSPNLPYRKPPIMNQSLDTMMAPESPSHLNSNKPSLDNFVFGSDASLTSFSQVPQKKSSTPSSSQRYMGTCSQTSLAGLSTSSGSSRSKTRRHDAAASPANIRKTSSPNRRLADKIAEQKRKQAESDKKFAELMGEETVEGFDEVEEDNMFDDGGRRPSMPGKLNIPGTLYKRSVSQPALTMNMKGADAILRSERHISTNTDLWNDTGFEEPSITPASNQNTSQQNHQHTPTSGGLSYIQGSPIVTTGNPDLLTHMAYSGLNNNPAYTAGYAPKHDSTMTVDAAPMRLSNIVQPNEHELQMHDFVHTVDAMNPSVQRHPNISAQHGRYIPTQSLRVDRIYSAPVDSDEGMVSTTQPMRSGNHVNGAGEIQPQQKPSPLASTPGAKKSLFQQFLDDEYNKTTQHPPLSIQHNVQHGPSVVSASATPTLSTSAIPIMPHVLNNNHSPHQSYMRNSVERLVSGSDVSYMRRIVSTQSREMRI
eukprot:CFRG7367T1